MKNCNEIQKLIAELSNNQVIDDKDILQHIENCQSCQDYQTHCKAMNDAFVGMNDFDADDALIESTLISILNLQEQTQKPKRRLNKQWASALAASFMLVSLIALFPYNSISNYGLISSSPESMDQIIPQAEKKEQRLKKNKSKQSDFELFDVEVADEVTTKYRRVPNKSAPASSLGVNPEPIVIGEFSANMTLQLQDKDNSKELMDKLSNDMNQNMKEELSQAPTGISFRSTRKPAIQRPDKLNELSTNNAPSIEAEDDQDNVELESVIVTGSRIRATDLEEAAPIFSINRESNDKDGRQNFDIASGTASDKSNEFISKQDLRKVIGNKNNSAATLQAPERKAGLLASDLKGKRDYSQLENSKDQAMTQALEEQKLPIEKALNPAQHYLADISSLQNLKTQNSSGYWANSYVPGDSAMRLLQTSLIQNNTLDLNNSISQNLQPFDYPDKNALAVYLSSDHAFIDPSQPTRMRLQVGIQAADRKGGRRTAMNIGLIFDLKGYDSAYAKKMKSLLMALLKAKQPGDNISLTIAGAQGGVLIEPNDFRQGSIQVALNNLFSEESIPDTSRSNTTRTETTIQNFSLKQALQAATVILKNNDDATASLGSSVMILFSANELNKYSEINSLVHQNAVSGITMSTVSLASENQETLNKLALVGQGHARILQSNDDAKRVIDAELLASSRAVARALRLRIRLAKGVKLINVLDSYNLNEDQAQRVRDAEQSLDKRLSKNLGITSDRGDDEEGIQIVIPSFYAGDTHVIILDVVVSNPGALADVSLRYKDLLYLRNAVTLKQLNLDGNPKQLGPLQLNVTKNLLAHRFSDQIKQASSYLRQGMNNQALSTLLEIQKLYQSMREHFPSWKSDVEILNDEKLIQQYLDLLNTNSITDSKQLNYIADSMQYISWRKNITKTD